MCHSTHEQARLELGMPAQVQRKLRDSFLGNDLTAARTCAATLREVCSPANARWRERRAARQVLKEISHQLKHGHEDARREAQRIVSCISSVLGLERTHALLERLELQYCIA